MEIPQTQIDLIYSEFVELRNDFIMSCDLNFLLYGKVIGFLKSLYFLGLFSRSEYDEEILFLDSVINDFN